jgi:hypothetical protein
MRGAERDPIWEQYPGRKKIIEIQCLGADGGEMVFNIAILDRTKLHLFQSLPCIAYPSRSDDAVVSRAIISLAHSLNLKIVAEGVETERQIQVLKERGCDVIQGYQKKRTGRFLGHSSSDKQDRAENFSGKDMPFEPETCQGGGISMRSHGGVGDPLGSAGAETPIMCRPRSDDIDFRPLVAFPIR